MNIGLYDVDSTIPNLALMKLSAWHKKKGDKVELYFPLKKYDYVFASQIFTDSKPVYHYDEIGGSGTQNWGKVLAPEIEHIMPDYDLYPKMDYSLGFTTRGCLRKCEFCFVPKKEGMIRVNTDIYEFWNPKHKKIIFMDNNATAQPVHLKKILKQVQKENLKVEFNQGLDLRLMTDDIANELKNTRLSNLFFAWDSIKTEALIMRGIDMLHKAGIRGCRFYVLVGFDSTIEEDLYRFNKLKEINKKYNMFIRAYCMRFKTCRGIKIYSDMANWVNSNSLYVAMTFEEFLKSKEKKDIISENQISLF